MKIQMKEVELKALLRTFALLGDAPTLKILYLLERSGEKSFTELKDILRINPATLSNRLKRLTQAGILVSDRLQDRLHVYYSIGDNRKALRKVLDSLERFADDLE